MPFYALLVLAFARGAWSQNTSFALTTWTSGIASLYGSNIGTPGATEYGATIGSCGYGDIPTTTWPFLSIAALPTTGQGYIQGPVQGCGTCYQISCVNDDGSFAGKCNDDWATESVTVQITDSCSECQPIQFDVQAQTFGRIAPEVNGRMNMQYRRVTCTPQGNIMLRIDGNNPNAWLRIFLFNLAGSGGVTSVAIRASGSNDQWQPMMNTFGAAWEIYTQPTQPSDLYITTDDGQTATIIGKVTAGATGIIDTGAQTSTTPAKWDQAPTIPSNFNPNVEPGSTTPSVTSVTFGAATESAVCCEACPNINFSGYIYSCAQQKAFGMCNSTFLNRPIKQQDATLEGLNINIGYCSRSCGRCVCS